jgi:hypothetical protein
MYDDKLIERNQEKYALPWDDQKAIWHPCEVYKNNLLQTESQLVDQNWMPRKKIIFD